MPIDDEPTEQACWRLLAGPESLNYYVENRRPGVTMWTTEKYGAVRDGDLVVFYGTRNLQSYVAVARVCCEPVQNSKARRLKKDRDYWAYLQVQPLLNPVPRKMVERERFASKAGSGLQQPRGGQANRIANEAVRPLLDVLTDDDPAGAKRVASWRPGGRGRRPRNLDLEELLWADWSPPETRSHEEVLLCRSIAKRLVSGRRFRYLAESDGVGSPPAKGDRPEALTLEHRIRDATGPGRIDILLVDTAASVPTLVLIEVKLRATLAPGRNPVPQAVRYAAAVRARDGAEWSVRPLVVAQHFDELVVDEALAHGLEVHTCSPVRGVLRPPLT